MEPAQPDEGSAHQGHLPDRPQKVLQHLTVTISRHIPVICAAGNDGESQMISLARIADGDNGIIAVGAVTAEGFRSAYSNNGDDLTVVAPSDGTRCTIVVDKAGPIWPPACDAPLCSRCCVRVCVLAAGSGDD
jgi:hypothetical protein